MNTQLCICGIEELDYHSARGVTHTPNENSGGTVAWTCDHIEYSVKAIYEVDVERAGLTDRACHR